MNAKQRCCSIQNNCFCFTYDCCCLQAIETKGTGAKCANENILMKQKIEEDNRKKAAAVKAKYDFLLLFLSK